MRSIDSGVNSSGNLSLLISLMLIDMLLHNATHPATCSYSPSNTSSSAVRKKFYSQLEKIAMPNYWLIGDYNAFVLVVE